MGCKSSSKIYKIVFFFLCLFFFSCTSTKHFLDHGDSSQISDCHSCEGENLSTHGDSSYLFPKEIVWQELREGVYQTEFTINCLGVYWTCVKVSLQNPNLFVKVWPEDLNQIGKSFKVKNFAIKNNTLVALNTSPFDKKNIPMGIIQVDGNLLIKPNPKYDALVLQKKQNKILAKIINQNLNSLSEFLQKKDTYIIGGYWQILKDKQIIDFYKSRRSRTAVGINEEQTYIYIFQAVPVFSILDKNGLYYSEVAQVLLNLGCSNAISFDGGTSTAMNVLGKNQKSPFFQKKVAACFGFYLQEAE